MIHNAGALFKGGVSVARINDSLDQPAPVIATGGLATVFAEDLEVLHAVDPGLTLEGLRLIWVRNRR